MKTIIQITLLILFTASSGAHANEHPSVWATKCDGKSNNPATLWIIRTTSGGLYQVDHPRLQLSKPTPIIGTKGFKKINDDTIIYKNITYKRCSKTEKTKYNPVTEEQIKKYLHGE